MRKDCAPKYVFYVDLLLMWSPESSAQTENKALEKKQVYDGKENTKYKLFCAKCLCMGGFGKCGTATTHHLLKEIFV